MNIAAFYHAWTAGRFQEPLAEFVDALRDSEFDGPVFFGWVADGNEHVTINRLREYAQTHDGAVLYAHTKGAATVDPFRDRWRRSMTDRVVRGWRENLPWLNNVDAVGCHWLTEEQYPGMFSPAMTVPAAGSGFFGGNFWIARCDYLRTLPECEAWPRWRAEEWIGINRPRVLDLLPGWPHDDRWPEICAA